MLEAQGLTIRAPRGGALFEKLDFALGPGEMVALSGANGSGKSVLCLALAGLLEPREGQVLVDGEPPGALGPARARVGILFQEPDAQLVTGTVEAELAFPLENLGWERARIEARVTELLSAFELGHLEGRPPERLSGGEKSRLALAAALAAGPAYLLLDEPGVYLDAGARRRLRELLAAERARGLGILWVTQLEEEWAEAGRRYLLCDGGLRPAPQGLALAEQRPAPRGPAPRSCGSGRPRIRARGLCFSYASPGPAALACGRAPLISGVDLDVFPEETVFIGGASGCGKTTLLLLLAGVLEPERGAVEVEAPPLGVLLQSPEDQLVCPTVLEDVAMGPRLGGAGSAEAADRARRALALAQLDARLVGPLPPSALSHGQRRRVAWAGVWALGAGTWLLDEPTCGLDEEGVLALENSVHNFVAGGGSVVIVTQDPRLDAWVGRRWLLAGGKLAPVGE